MVKFLHSMIRISDPAESLWFFELIGLEEVRRVDVEAGRFTLIFLAAPGQENIAEIELTYNWPDNWVDEGEGGDAATSNSPAPPIDRLRDSPHDSPHDRLYDNGRNFGHLAFQVENIYDTCARLMEAGVTINRPPRDGHMAFVKSPDNISIELLQDGYLPSAEPWASMENSGDW